MLRVWERNPDKTQWILSKETTHSHNTPLWRRVDFKMATLVYLSLSGMAPAYLATDCQLVSNVYQIKDVVCG